MKTCEIFSVGTELLLGDILNTDAQFLARRLAELGIAVLYQQTVGDNRERLAALVRQAISRSDIVITSGGLGPTADDLTKEVCCEVMGFPLATHAQSLEQMLSYFKTRGGEMPETNLKQAELPVGGTVFPNENGTAPGCAVERDGKIVIMLPGPPRELKPMFEQSVVPLLARFSGGTLVSHTVRTFGIGESAMAEATADLLEQENPTVAPYAKDGEALLRVTARAQSKEEADALIRPVLEEIDKRLGQFIYGVDVDSMQEAVVALLKKHGLRLGLAESCTAGYVAKRLTEISGSSDVFECGIVSYSNRIKTQILGVSEETLREKGAVSEEVARQMAVGALRVSGADLAVSITGIAGPGPSEGGKPAGLSWLALTDGKQVWTRQLSTGHTTGDNREYNRYVTASNALDLVRCYLQNYPVALQGGFAL